MGPAGGGAYRRAAVAQVKMNIPKLRFLSLKLRFLRLPVVQTLPQIIASMGHPVRTVSRLVKLTTRKYTNLVQIVGM